MSEKYGACFRCNGRGSVGCGEERHECPRCGGTGFEGSADVFMTRETQKEDALQKRKSFVISSGETNAK